MCLVVVVDGCLKKGVHIVSSHSGKFYDVREVGILAPHEIATEQL